jgi:3-phenylpropionate/trans-cinnamate dioxygenase ferredoxin subunit
MSPDKKHTWFKVAENIGSLPWQNNDLCTAEVNGKIITIAKYHNTLFACAYKCPHAGGIMADGWVDAGGIIVCPLHRYKFKLENGRNTSGEGYYLKTYAIEQRDDGIYVGIEQKGFFNWS